MTNSGSTAASQWAIRINLQSDQALIGMLRPQVSRCTSISRGYNNILIIPTVQHHFICLHNSTSSAPRHFWASTRSRSLSTHLLNYPRLRAPSPLVCDSNLHISGSTMFYHRTSKTTDDKTGTPSNGSTTRHRRHNEQDSEHHEHSHSIIGSHSHSHTEDGHAHGEKIVNALQGGGTWVLKPYSQLSMHLAC